MVGTADLRTLACEPEEDRRARRLVWVCSVCALFAAAALFGLISSRVGTVPKSKSAAVTFVPVAFLPPAPSPAGSDALDSTPGPAQALAANQSPQVERAVIPLNPNRNAAAVRMLQPAPERALPTRPAPAQNPPIASRFEPHQDAIFTPQPAYPALAQRRGQEGRVRIEFTVEPSGRLADVRVVQSSGFALLDEAAVAVVRDQWQFPAGLTRHHFVDIVFQLK